MKSILRLLPACLSVGFLVACGVPLPEDDLPAPALVTQDFADGNDGSHSQGTLLHGTSYGSIAFANAAMLRNGERRPVTLRLERGELVADLTLRVEGTTPSLTDCLVQGPSGPDRSCGLTVAGQGTCTPGARVKLNSGGLCGGRPSGSCSGTPVMRVCSGEAPCEDQGPNHLATGAPACSAATCPSAAFHCPSSGVYTVLAGADTPGTPWSLSVDPNEGAFPATTQELRGTQLVGLLMRSSTSATMLEVTEAINAREVATKESPGTWDPSGSTFLYRVQTLGGLPLSNICDSNPDPNGGEALAVPVRGLYDDDGVRTESTTAFTLACDYAVISKCYRWGYKPWLDGAQAGPVTQAHWACTRMARADYCGAGDSYTNDGTLIRLWDGLTPTINPPPANPIPAVSMTFEAGWKTNGAACLSHWRWKTLQANTCINLNWPIYDANGNVTNDCRSPGATEKCSAICDDAKEAAHLFGATVFNESRTNGP
ncbi:ADYC domain-containing protein [Corallococcus sp. bb12-1]|uniref:ADYC domain-containing protein n=1 Tax=Corallococcus sp. bb12-1 TaxID=2996784 RepID=UPI00226E61E7|nr:ADYC domain-containing protein [Corallococcus sp. bb12-1]MCY1043916.1 ADYC domain-containing protein [Corallococcus sp. bb12-1]